MSEPLRTIQQILTKKSTPEVRASVQKFVPGSQKIYGVKMPELNLLAKQFSSGGFVLAKSLWESGSFEEKILAVKILQRVAKKDPEQSIRLLQHFSKGIDNWAVCDALGMQALKSIVKTHSRNIFALATKYSGSSDHWKRRLALVLVEWYTREKSFHPAIRAVVKKLETDDNYYVKKAVEWIKRNMAKGK